MSYFSPWRQRLKRWLAAGTSPGHRYRPNFEPLEDRHLLATFTVTTSADSGPGSLRQAILDANANAGADTIAFNIQPSGVQTIKPASALPDITDPVMIDGTTQPGFQGAPIIELNGFGLVLKTNNSTVQGLVINRFGGSGILIEGSGNIVSSNYIGTDVTGTKAPGTAAIGIQITASNNTIGGTARGAGNVIAGVSQAGISIINSATGNLIQGNFIGVDTTGTVALGSGVSDGVDAGTGNTVGGRVFGARNIISGNGRDGIEAGANTLIEGNLIGTDLSGTVAIGNGHDGISIAGGAGVTVGGTAIGARNIISGNANGIEIGGAGNAATPDLIQDNFIGTQTDGKSPLGNTLRGILIGGVGAGTAGNYANIIGNTIAFTFGPGIDLLSGVGDLFSQNSMFANAGLGIDLGDDGITPNHPGGSTTGPNNLQNHPIITSANTAGGTTTIQGTLNSTPSTKFTVEFFSNGAVDASGYIEGKTFVGQATVTTDANGNASFSFAHAAVTDTVFTATATDPNNDTSECWQPAFITGVPSIRTLSPASSGAEGTTSFSISIFGANFVHGSTVLWNGTPVPTNITNSNLISANLTAANFADEGQVAVAVANPAPGGGTSNTLPFTVQEFLPDGTRGTANQRFVSELYHDLLNRQVDATGLAAWGNQLDQGASRQSIVAAIEASQEYRTDQVQAMYSLYLHRQADPAGLSAFVPFLQSGGTVEQAASAILGSPEYFQNRGGGSNDGFLSALYQDALNRALDPFGQNAWEQQLAAGTSRAQVAAQILASSEYQQDLVRSLYLQFLDRQVDSYGLNFWQSQLQQGMRDEQVIAGVVGSGEYYNKTAS